MKEIDLIPSCSELTMRIDISKLDKQQVDFIKTTWDKGVLDYLKDENEGDDLENRPEGSELEEESIFGVKCLKASGDFPYNCSETVDTIIDNIKKKIPNLKTESEEI